MGKSITGRGIGAPDFVKEYRPVVYTLSSDKDLHFTEALTKNGVEREDITGLRSNRIRINEVTIQADQQLFYKVLLYSTDDFDESDLDNDKFIAAVELNLPVYGFTQTEAQYRLSVKGLDIDYIDEDLTKELHVVLQNLSPTAKITGATGEVKIDFKCEERA